MSWFGLFWIIFSQYLLDQSNLLLDTKPRKVQSCELGCLWSNSQKQAMKQLLTVIFLTFLQISVYLFWLDSQKQDRYLNTEVFSHVVKMDYFHSLSLAAIIWLFNRLSFFTNFVFLFYHTVHIILFISYLFFMLYLE